MQKLLLHFLDDTNQHILFSNKIIYLAIAFFVVIIPKVQSQDINGDGTISILIIGTSVSIQNNYKAFSPFPIAAELERILSADPSIAENIEVVAEDLYRSKTVSTGIGGMFTANRNYYCHSFMQYYYWPDSSNTRINNLTGNNGIDWDYVVMAADPYLISNIPGYYSLGMHKIAAKVAQGAAVPLLLMQWLPDSNLTGHFEEFSYRAADGAPTAVEVIPAGLAWNKLLDHQKDSALVHPSPNGAYITAASIYAHIYQQTASMSNYLYDDSIADIAFSTWQYQASQSHYSGPRTFMSPYKSCGINANNLVYNHGGTSTENGILNGLQWVVSEAPKTLQYASIAPIHFNYGRSSMGSTHLYLIDSSRFDYSFGYPLQDDRSTGYLTMLYGLDKRRNSTDVETDIGTVRQMLNLGELPYARNVPLRTLAAQMMETIPGVSLYSDNWHMSADFNKAIATFMYTMLTGDCALSGITAPTDSVGWRTWMSHKIGYETAWTFMHLESNSPCYSPSTTIESGASISQNLLEANVFPNPNHGFVSIDLGQVYPHIQLTLRDLVGRIVQIQTYQNHQFINLKLNHTNGVYILSLNNGLEDKTIQIIKY